MCFSCTPYRYIQYLPILYICVYVHFAAACCFATIASPARHDGSPLLFTMSLMDFVVSRELGCSRATLVSNARVTSPPSPTSPLPSHTCARTSYTHIYIVYIYTWSFAPRSSRVRTAHTSYRFLTKCTLLYYTVS